MGDSSIFDGLYQKRRFSGYQVEINGVLQGDFRTLGDVYDKIDQVGGISSLLSKSYFRYLWTLGIVAIEINRGATNLAYRVKKHQ